MRYLRGRAGRPGCRRRRRHHRPDLLLVSGPTYGKGQAWGCEDIDGDGRREVIQVTVRPQEAAAQWTKDAYHLTGATIELVKTETGTMAASGPPEDQAESLAGQC